MVSTFVGAAGAGGEIAIHIGEIGEQPIGGDGHLQLQRRLRELDLPVSGFNASHKPHRPDKFKNRRSEQWWHVRELFEELKAWRRSQAKLADAKQPPTLPVAVVKTVRRSRVSA